MNSYIASVPQHVLTGASQLNGKYRRLHKKKKKVEGMTCPGAYTMLRGRHALLGILRTIDCKVELQTCFQDNHNKNQLSTFFETHSTPWKVTAKARNLQRCVLPRQQMQIVLRRNKNPNSVRERERERERERGGGLEHVWGLSEKAGGLQCSQTAQGGGGLALIRLKQEVIHICGNSLFAPEDPVVDTLGTGEGLNCESLIEIPTIQPPPKSSTPSAACADRLMSTRAQRQLYWKSSLEQWGCKAARLASTKDSRHWFDDR